MTHGHPDAWRAASVGTVIVSCALSADNPRVALEEATSRLGEDEIDHFLNPAVEWPASTAGHALAIGFAAAAEGGEIAQVLTRAHQRGGVGASTYAGALHGALNGVGAIPSHWLERAELSWVADQLARDAITQQKDRPVFDGYGSSSPDSIWAVRYPGN